MDYGKDRNVVVSIIIPVYNSKPYIDEALKSVIKQSYTDLEIIVVDDGSVDGSEKICEMYADKDERIHLIHQENRGLSAARNRGLDSVTGEYVAFLDSDDALHWDFIRVMINEALCTGSDIVECRCDRYHVQGLMNGNSTKTIDQRYEQEIYNNIQALKALAKGSLSHVVWNKLYKRNLWKDIRFPDGHVYEEVDTTYRLIEKSKRVCALSVSLYNHRIRNNSISGNCSQSKIADWFLAYNHFESFIELNIPDIFSYEELNIVRSMRIKPMIGFYGKYKDEGLNDNEFRKKLRRTVISFGKKYCVGECDLETRVAYAMICYFPRLFRFFFGIGYPIRELLYGIAGG